MPTVIVLNGTSSAGKSAIARAFQEIAPRLFLNFSIDTILGTLPRSAIDRITRSADISDLRYPELARAFYACVRELLGLGHDLVIDNAVTARYQAELLLSATASHHVLLVGVRCSAATLRERERQRGDRRPGLAEQQLERIDAWLEYDLVVDTSKVSAEAAAAEILQSITRGGEAVERVRAKLRVS